MIELRTVTKTYPGAGEGFTALNHVDLKIPTGEYVAIVGKSGSGKSTLLNMLTGIDHPSTGTVVINNTDVHTLGESELARKERRDRVPVVSTYPDPYRS